MSEPTPESHPREWAVFSQIDTNGDGSLTGEEFASALEEMGEGSFAYKMMDAMDTDGDGNITFTEFCHGFDALYTTVPDSAYALEDKADEAAAVDAAATQEIAEEIVKEE